MPWIGYIAFPIYRTQYGPGGQMPLQHQLSDFGYIGWNNVLWDSIYPMFTVYVIASLNRFHTNYPVVSLKYFPQLHVLLNRRMILRNRSYALCSFRIDRKNDINWWLESRTVDKRYRWDMPSLIHTFHPIKRLMTYVS